MQEQVGKVELRTEITKQVHVLRVRGPFHVFDASFDLVKTHVLVGESEVLQGAFFVGFDFANLVLKAVVATSKKQSDCGVSLPALGLLRVPSHRTGMLQNDLKERLSCFRCSQRMHIQRTDVATLPRTAGAKDPPKSLECHQ